jgi:hypothetical protein
MNLTYRNYSLSFTSNTIVLINIVANMIIWQEYTARNLSKTKSILKIISCWERLSYLHYSRPLFQSFLVFSSSMNKLVVGSPYTSLVHCLCFPDSPFHDLVALSSKTTKGLGPYIHWRVKMEWSVVLSYMRSLLKQCRHAVKNAPGRHWNESMNYWES